MCGILGWAGITPVSQSERNFQSANSVAAHRGPDGEGISGININSRKIVDLDVGDSKSYDVLLGHRRLAIIDVSKMGRQPMVDRSGLLSITYNGEVYNYLEVRKDLEELGHEFVSTSDTEVILSAYSEWGSECVNRFEGMWAFAIVDLRRNVLFCSRDRWGIKPFHYVFNDGEFSFASEIKQLLELGVVGKSYDRSSVAAFLVYGAVECSENTFFESVKKLPQGHNLEFCLHRRTVTITKYYSPDFSLDQKISVKDASVRFRELLTESVDLHLRSDVAVGSCLSGGLDSTSVVLITKELLSLKGKSVSQETFSSHFDAEEANEWAFMKQAFDVAGTKTNVVRPSEEGLLSELDDLILAQEEPFGSTSIYAQWCVYRLASKCGVKVLLDGQGADEILAGYVGLSHSYDQELVGKRKFPRLLYEQGCRNKLSGSPHVFYDLLKDGMKFIGHKTGIGALAKADSAIPAASTSWANQELLTELGGSHPYIRNQAVRAYGSEEVLGNVLFQLTFLNNLQSLLKYSDRNSMAFSVESRVPFVHRPLIEFAFSLPSHHKIRDGYTKRILRDSMEGILPPAIQNRVSKLGFATPEQTWFKGGLGDKIRESLEDPALNEFMDTGKAADYFERINTLGIRDSAPWRWYNFVRWRELFSLS